jgi:hypothetical protein
MCWSFDLDFEVVENNSKQESALMDQGGARQCGEDIMRTWFLFDLVLITKFRETCL